MPKLRGRALVIDADATVRRSLARALVDRDIEPLTSEDGVSGLALLRAQPADVALIEAGPNGEGLATARTIASEHAGMAIVVIAPAAGAEAAVEAAWAIGADVLHKPIDPPALAALFAVRAIEKKRFADEARSLAARADDHAPIELTGTSVAAREVLRFSTEAARTPAPLLVIGEEGTGRDRLARLVHDKSRRSMRAFVSFSCAQLEGDPEGGRIFGAFEEGQPHEGLADVADRGTLFLDAIEALPIDAQDRLLLLLSRGEVARAGGEARVVADVRVAAGTSVDLGEHVRAGTFREELWYRLRALQVRLLPLRERVEDVPLIAFAFLRQIREETGREVRRISPEAMRLLRHHPWPGNARELHSALAHAVALAKGDVIFPSDLPFSAKIPNDPPSELFDAELADLPYVEARKRAVSAFEMRYTRLVIARENGNLSGAARRAGMDRSNFKRLLRRTKAG